MVQKKWLDITVMLIFKNGKKLTQILRFKQQEQWFAEFQIVIF